LLNAFPVVNPTQPTDYGLKFPKLGRIFLAPTSYYPINGGQKRARAWLYQTTKVQIVQAATNNTKAIKEIPYGRFACSTITWRFFFRSCGAVGFDTGLPLK